MGRWLDNAPKKDRKQWEKVRVMWSSIKSNATRLMADAVERYKRAHGGKQPPAKKSRAKERDGNSASGTPRPAKARLSVLETGFPRFFPHF